ncbi:hypothetical protein CAT7_01637 [Carnobacterium sp. AT7]|mgnify:CR=1 FL=1|nr:hypothetical protein CAT7_01637 [Carnobacterium sp. AT7]
MLKRVTVIFISSSFLFVLSEIGIYIIGNMIKIKREERFSIHTQLMSVIKNKPKQIIFYLL